MTFLVSDCILQDDFSDQPYYSVDTPPVVSDYDRNLNYDLTSHLAYASKLFFWDRIKNHTPSVLHNYSFWSPHEEEIDLESQSSFVNIISILDFLQSEPNSRTKREQLLWWSVYASETEFQNLSQTGNEISLKRASHEYFAILSSNLAPFGFSESNEYQDSFGGRVIDYYSNDERVTCIVSTLQVQILSFLKGVFNEKVFDRSGSEKLNIIEYIEILLNGRVNEDLDSTDEH